MIARSALAAGIASAIALTSAHASAQDRRELLGRSHRGFESPQNFALEIRFAPYTPDIDSEFTNATPYKDVFGTMPRLLVQLEFDWQALRIPHLGTLGPGLGAGYTTMSANATFSTPHVAPDGTTTSTSGEQTSLDIYPFYGVAVLRADALWREAGVPLVPYAKVGVGYALWRASNTLGTSTESGVAGKGHSWGTHVAVGLAFNLNSLDPYSAKNFDNSMGVNGTYLFGEWMRSDLTGLGFQEHPLRVGTTTWVAGLAFEF